jgi:hypothetical protein
VEAESLKRLWHLSRTSETNPGKKFTFTRMEGTRWVGRPPIMWPDSVGQELKTLQIRNWKKKKLETDQWRGILRRSRLVTGFRTTITIIILGTVSVNTIGNQQLDCW